MVGGKGQANYYLQFFWECFRFTLPLPYESKVKIYIYLHKCSGRASQNSLDISVKTAGVDQASCLLTASDSVIIRD